MGGHAWSLLSRQQMSASVPTTRTLLLAWLLTRLSEIALIGDASRGDCGSDPPCKLPDMASISATDISDSYKTMHDAICIGQRLSSNTKTSSTTNQQRTTSARMISSNSNNNNKKSMNSEGGRRRRVTFEDSNNTTYDPPPALSPEDCQAIWYSAQELKTSLQDDIRGVVRHYMKRVKNGEQPDDKNYIVSMHYSSDTTYSRGLDLLNPDEKNRRARCELYRSLVLRQYNALQTAGMFSENHAIEMLQTFATEKSRYARAKASSIAAADASQARQVYRDAFLAKEGVDQGLGILPSSSSSSSAAAKMRRSLRGQVKRNSDRARSA